MKYILIYIFNIINKTKHFLCLIHKYINMKCYVSHVAYYVLFLVQSFESVIYHPIFKQEN